MAILQHNGGKTAGWLTLYMGLAAAVTIIALYFARETRSVSMSGRDSAEAAEELHDVAH